MSGNFIHHNKTTEETKCWLDEQDLLWSEVTLQHLWNNLGTAALQYIEQNIWSLDS
jgi:hypothetical protein